MNEKRFYKQKSTIEDYMIYDEDKEDAYFVSCNDESDVDYLVDLLNELNDENEQLKKENKEYTKLFNCRNCGHLNYDWYDGGDEFEVCDMGNTERLMYHRFCKDWKRG